jgi:hypothetical protein
MFCEIVKQAGKPGNWATEQLATITSRWHYWHWH